MKSNNIFKQIKQIKIDKNNLHDFQEYFRLAFADPRSDFNKFNLKLDEDEQTISTVVSLPENYENVTDAMKYKKLKEIVKPINDYLIMKTTFVEYINLPEFYAIEDAEDEKWTGNYLIVWKFNPVVLNDKKFWWKLGLLSGGSVVGVAGIVTALILLL